MNALKGRRVRAKRSKSNGTVPDKIYNPESLAVLSARSLAKALSPECSKDETMETLRSFPSDYIAKLVCQMPWHGVFALWKSGDPFFCDQIMAETLDASMKLEEDGFRQKFATARNSKVLDEMHLMLIDVYDNTHLFKIAHYGARKKHLELMFSNLRCAPKTLLVQRKGQPSVVNSLEDFRRNFSIFSDGLLADINWKNVFAAGGSCAACLLSADGAELNSLSDWRRWFSPDESWIMVKGKDKATVSPFRSSSDIDLFLYGLSVEEANKKIGEIHESIQARSSSPVLLVRNGSAITLVTGYPRRHIQIVLRLYKTPAEVLMGFDLDMSCIGYDGEKVWVLPRAMRALNMRYNMVDLSRRSLTYELRLFKYAKRGICVGVPGLARHRVDPALYDLPLVSRKKFQQAAGLRKLLLLEKIAKDKETATCCSHNHHYQHPEQHPWAGHANSHCSETKRACQENNFTWRMMLCHTTGWDAQSRRVPLEPTIGDMHDLEVRELQREQLQRGVGNVMVGSSDYENIAIPFKAGWDIAKIVHLLQRTHQRLENAISWIGDELRKAPVVRSSFQPNEIVDKAMWITNNPGRQIMTGSFHPLPAEGWAGDVHLPPAVHQYYKVILLSVNNDPLSRKHVLRAILRSQPELGERLPASEHDIRTTYTDPWYIRSGLVIRQAATKIEADRLQKHLASIPASAKATIRVMPFKVAVSDDQEEVQSLPQDLHVANLRGDPVNLCGYCQRFLLVPNRCQGCLEVSYCNADCQKAHWKSHKKVCTYGKKNAKAKAQPVSGGVTPGSDPSSSPTATTATQSTGNSVTSSGTQPSSSSDHPTAQASSSNGTTARTSGIDYSRFDKISYESDSEQEEERCEHRWTSEEEMYMARMMMMAQMMDHSPGCCENCGEPAHAQQRRHYELDSDEDDDGEDEEEDDEDEY